MDRRSFVTGIGGFCVTATLSGCLREDENDDDEEPDGNPGREIDVRSENITVEREFPDQEAGVFQLHLTNTAAEPRTVEVALQMRDADGDPVGSEHVKTHGPIEPQTTTAMEFELSEEQRDLVWYRIVVTDAAPQEE